MPGPFARFTNAGDNSSYCKRPRPAAWLTWGPNVPKGQRQAPAGVARPIAGTAITALGKSYAEATVSRSTTRRERPSANASKLQARRAPGQGNDGHGAPSVGEFDHARPRGLRPARHNSMSDGVGPEPAEATQASRPRGGLPQGYKPKVQN